MREHARSWDAIHDHSANPRGSTQHGSTAGGATPGRQAARRALATGTRLIAILATGLGMACVSVHRPAVLLPEPEREWPATLESSKADALRGAFTAADTVLAAFAAAYPGSPEALETWYWRGLLRMDPSNQHSSMSAAIASLDKYLGDHRPREHVIEATTLRHLAAQIDGLNRLAASEMEQAKESPAPAPVIEVHPEVVKASTEAQAANDAEVKRLKDELAKANAELERIKKRLSQPPPPQPPQG